MLISMEDNNLITVARTMSSSKKKPPIGCIRYILLSIDNNFDAAAQDYNSSYAMCYACLDATFKSNKYSIYSFIPGGMYILPFK